MLIRQAASQRTGHRPRPAVLLAALATTGGLLAAAPQASAGTYLMRNCSPPVAPAVPSGSIGPWTGFGVPTGGSYDTTCTPGTADTFGVAGDRLGPATQAGFELAIPASRPIELRHLKAWWTSQSATDGASSAVIDNNGTVIPSSANLAAGTPDDVDLSGKDVKLESTCPADHTAGCVFGGTTTPLVTILGTEVTLAESVPPTATITGTPLLGGSQERGLQPLGYSASDADSGVASVAVQLNGTTVASRTFDGDPSLCPHVSLTACGPQRSGVLQVDTKKVPDGTYTLALVVTDAAGNVGLASKTGQVRIANARKASTTAHPPHWRVSLHATPAIVHRGSRVLFSGRILSTPLDYGKLVVLQVRQSGRWRAFATIRAKSTGAFQERQRFSQSTGLLRFRAVVPSEKGYSYLTGHSTIVHVRVRA
jgi:hypothetical protein